METLPEKAGIRRNHTGWGFSFGDRLSPLWGFLKKNAGRPWDEVYSEICQHADNRSIRGYHVREHVQDYVTGSGGQDYPNRYWRRSDPFWVDDEGILCFGGDRNKYHYPEPKLDPNQCKIGNRLFERVNECWFEVWYEKESKCRKRWNYTSNQEEVEYSYNEIKVCQRQLSKKDLRDLGLKNDLNFK